MFIVAQIFGLGAMVSLFLIYQQKSRKKLLFCKLCADVFWSLHYLCLGAYGVTQAINVGSKAGGPVEARAITVDGDCLITLKGWCIVGGGVEKYVWSADGGVTWNDCGNLDKLGSVPEKNIGVAKALSSSKGYESAEASLKNSSFQGTNAITVDLSDYAGKTVNVIVAAVPASEPDSFCLLYRFKDVAVGEQ